MVRCSANVVQLIRHKSAQMFGTPELQESIVSEYAVMGYDIDVVLERRFYVRKRLVNEIAVSNGVGLQPRHCCYLKPSRVFVIHDLYR